MIIVVMGVSGSGKSTIGELLARSLKWEFSDADSFHSILNIEKMSRGIPLNDADRIPWLMAMQQVINDWLEADKSVVLACSALKITYRHILFVAPERMRLVYLQGSFELINARLAKRQNHFMNKDLLQSQLQTLQEPAEGICIDASLSPEAIVDEIRNQLKV